MYEMLFSCLWSIFYFSLFCSTIVGWKSRSSDEKTDENSINLGAGSAKAIITFGFFSTGLWGYLGYLALLKFQSGNFALPQFDDDSMQGAKPFASFPAPAVAESNTFGDTTRTPQTGLQPADLTY
jgi:hypothetical protein